MKIFRSEQIREIDTYTIKYEPVSSIDLMERAATQLFRWITEQVSRSERILIFTGPGNNGGDGLALARMLVVSSYNVEIHNIKISARYSPDWQINFQRLESETSIRLNIITSTDEFPVVSEGDIIVDSIFGSGLDRPVEGLASEIIKLINKSEAKIISVDIPSGLFGEDNSNNSYDSVIRADHTLSFQFPKLAFMFAENSQYTGEWIVLPINLDNNIIRNTETPYYMLENKDIKQLLIKRKKFDHKGVYGHGLFIGGSWGRMGAAILGAGAALRSGIGLITCHIPYSGRVIMQSALPEAMTVMDKCEKYISEIADTDRYDAVAIGPGLGTSSESHQALYNLLSVCKKPTVIDADGLNILSFYKIWLSLLPAGTILTPHPREFERLTEKVTNSYARLERQISFSKEYNCILILKGAHTSITTPEGKVHFNNTGNPGMATAGSGDVLTGIILSLLAQGYTAENAALAGVYLHGMAGDIASEKMSYESILASDIINNIGNAFMKIREQNT